MKKIPSILVLSLLAGGGVLHWWFEDEKSVGMIPEMGLTTEPSVRRIKEKPVPLSRREILDGLPEHPGVIGVHGILPEQNAAMDIYRQFGVVEGAGALDYLLGKYGPGSAGVAYAMAYALTGWMERDFEAAMTGFREFSKEPNHQVWKVGHLNPADSFLFQWKGEKFHSGLM